MTRCLEIVRPNCHYGQFVCGNQPRLVFGVLLWLYAGGSAYATPPEARGLMAQHSLRPLQFLRAPNCRHSN
jgi:hypothetical protein